MCGIFGIVKKSGVPAEADVKRLTDLVAHRGPDGGEIRISGNVGLGHRRLSIIDLSAAGTQPMRHVSQPIWITYNGEIYNYIELRQELESQGIVFTTATDTEVLLNAYLAWGERCLEKFNGMWAFAIHDERDDTLFCARDRFGVKPFYYVETANEFAFGSEIRQLLPLLDRRVADGELVSAFLISGLSDHTSGTFFKGVAKLPPGHFLRADAKTGNIAVKQFYRLTPNAAAAVADPDQAAAELRSLLADAVKLRLRSDVRVGTCLSGGLDSSSVATLASAQHAASSAEAFCAITAVSEQESNNEEKYAEAIVRNSWLNWIRTRPTYSDFLSSVETLIDVQEEPFSGPSIMMQYAVMKAARENGVTVLLDGQGGDETLLGYDRYYSAWLLARWRSGGIGEFAKAFRSASTVNTNVPPWRLAMYFFGAGFGAVRALAYWARYRFLKSRSMPDALWRFARATRDAAAMQKLEITETNLPMLLRFEDKNSMHFGIEARLPFLDYRLVEYALGLDTAVKMNGGWTKWPLRAAMNNVLPNDICWRRDKIGFAAPDRIWLTRHAPAMRSEVLNSALIAAHANMKMLGRMFDGLDLTMKWRLFCVALWSRQFGVSAV